VKNWGARTKEVAYLLNPAFCARLIYSAVNAYNAEAQRKMPFPLVYLILPLLLHKRTREKINSRTQMLIWIQSNESLLVNFAERAKQLVQITNEAIELLLQSKLLTMDGTAELEVSRTQKALSETKLADDEVKACIAKSKHIAKWFVKAGKVETIYIGLGVRP